MTKKKLYQKPEIKQVDLVPEEAVLTACKMLGSTGANQLGPADCYRNPGHKCSLEGS